MSRELSMTWKYLMRPKNAMAIVPLIGLYVGWKIEKIEYDRLSLFKDRSALFGREHGPDYKPSW
jgi:hypothetical protein